MRVLALVLLAHSLSISAASPPGGRDRGAALWALPRLLEYQTAHGPVSTSASATSGAGATDTSSSDCDTKAYQKASLSLISSSSMASLFDDGTTGDDRPGVWEASGIALAPPVGPGAPPPPSAVIVMDNSARLAVLLPPASPPIQANDGEGTSSLTGTVGVLLPPPSPLPAPADPARPGASEWEGVAFGPDAGTVLALVEAAACPPGKPEAADAPRRARVDELRLPGSLSPSSPPSAPTLVRSCFVDFDLPSDNKGLEDLVFLGGGRALFLCEGNGCVGGKEGRDRQLGGLLLLATLDFSPAASGEPGGCVWRVDKKLPLPASAAFEDYSGLALHSGVLAVLSQADAAVWVGRFDADAGTISDLPTVQEEEAGKAGNGTSPAVRSKWPGPVFPLPRDRSCRRALCTAEGIGWLDPPTVPGARLAITTDRAKPGLFPWTCVGEAQGVHVLGLPDRGEVVMEW